MNVVIPRATRITELNNQLRRDLQKKQRELAKNVAARLGDPAQRTSPAAAAIRRNEKSIALLTFKLLCPHPDAETKFAKRGKNDAATYQVRCPDCKASTFLHTVV